MAAHRNGSRSKAAVTRIAAHGLAMLVLAAMISFSTVADEKKKPGKPPTAEDNIVVGGDFPGSFKLPGPDRPPPPPSR